MDPDSLAFLALLSLKQLSEQFVGLMALASFADKSKCHSDNIVAKGALPLLVVLLKSAHPETQDLAIFTLASIAADHGKHLKAISAQVNGSGALPAVAAALKTDDSNMQVAVATLLTLLSEDSASNQDAITAAGALPGLAYLASSGSAPVCTAAGGAPRSLMTGSQFNRDAVIATGILPWLPPCQGQIAKNEHEIAALMFTLLAHQSKTDKASVVAYGGLPVLVALMKSDQPDEQSRGANCLPRICSGIMCQTAGHHGSRCSATLLVSQDNFVFNSGTCLLYVTLLMTSKTSSPWLQQDCCL